MKWPALRPADADSRALAPPARGPLLDLPIRSVLFGETRFAQHGHSLAHAQASRASRWFDSSFFPRLTNNISTLREALAALEGSAAHGRHLSPAAQWMLDNAVLIEEQLSAIKQALPRRFYRRLPVLRDDAMSGLPRIYGLAWAWVAHSDSGFDEQLFLRYLEAYQEVQALTLGELFALHTTLRVVLIENLRRLAERVVARNAARDAAHAWVDRTPGDSPPSAAVMAALERRGILTPYLLTVWQRLEMPQDAVAPRARAAWLAERLPDPNGALAEQQNETAEDQQSIRNAITTLHALARVDWLRLIEPCSATLLRLQTCAVHAAEDSGTQSETLHAVERLARASGRSELDVAHTLVDLTATAASADQAQAAPAYWWRGAGEAVLRHRLGLPARRLARRGSAAYRRVATPLYLLTIGAAMAVVLPWVMRGAPADLSPALWLLTLLCAAGPVSEACVAVINRLISESARPSRLPRLAFEQGLPADQQCLVVMPVILASMASVRHHAAQLEQHALANPQAHTQFALLSDFADAAAQSLPADAALLDSARHAISQLNDRHARGLRPPRFLLLHRERSWSDSEQRWIGWERKRGKLEALLRSLVEAAYQPFADLGELSTVAAGTRYVITLDADTDLLPGRLRSLVGIAAHPLNQPRWDAKQARVVEGYGIVQPRLETPLPAPETFTRFHALHNGECGLDPYSAATSEVYQDLFGEGSFTGKGLLNVAAVHQALCQRFPDGRLLSHDLIEGSLARCGAASDVTVAEDAPVHADVAASRLHRWTRGDWQLLPFLFGRARVRVAGINRWKMLDNLRRSLVAPGTLLLLMLSLACGALPLSSALALIVAAFAAGPLIGAVAGFAPSRDDIGLRRFYSEAAAELLRAAAVALWHLAQLLQLAMMYSDAIGRALWRQFVSHRRTLQWTTAATAQASARSDLTGLLRVHWRVPAAAALLAAVLAVAAAGGAPVRWDAAAVLLTLWAASPLWTWWISRTRPRVRRARLGNADQTYLMELARDTWRFYERHVGAEDSHLPPDNVQLVPRPWVAHRTSPTNVGLYLLSVACARELGFIGTVEMAERLAATLATVQRLPKHAGHLFNWYDTRSGAVLPPAYVSAVDSGNLAAHLLLLAQACEERAASVVLPADVHRAVQTLLRRPSAMRRALAEAGSLGALSALVEDVEGLSQWPPPVEQARRWQDQLARARQELDGLALGTQPGMPASPVWMLLDLVHTLGSHLRDQLEDLQASHAGLRALAEQARAMALAMDFSLLYDPRRRLLHIGLHVETGQLDRGHYDLLASEARLTSLVAIAKGDLPATHWQALGRPFGAQGSNVVLRSWSGSMFEYLMPTLVMEEPLGSALQRSGRGAVAEHVREGRAHGTPWGISESAIALQDHTMAYQYGPQGVARLAMRRTPTDERVIAPYASGLALLVSPAAAVANLRALEQLDARRALGFIEAIDYSPQRQASGKSYTLVQTHMAHHQAMIFIAAASVLSDGVPQAWARRQPHLRAVAGLLHERAPREALELREPRSPEPPQRARREPMVHVSAPMDDAMPPTQWLGNRRYGLVLRSNGAGYSHCHGQGLTRWRDDLLRDDRGSFVYVRRAGGAPHSVTARPAPDKAADYACRMQPDRVIFDCQWPDLAVRTSVWVSPEDDCELRQVDLVNRGDVDIDLVVSLASEPTLVPHAADQAHPAFSNLFIDASWDADQQALWFRRRPRLAGDDEWRAVHTLAAVDGARFDVQPCAQRLRWIGRHGSAAAPVGRGGWQALPSPTAHISPLPGVAMDTGLDPVAVLAVNLRLARAATCQLTFVSAAGQSQDVLDALLDKYRPAHHAERASNLSHTMASILLHDMRLDAPSWSALLTLQTLLGQLSVRNVPEGDAARQCDRRTLYRHGIGGERPILLVTIHSELGLSLVHTLMRATMAWAVAGQGIDLVVVNGEPQSYLTPVQHDLLHAMHSSEKDPSRPRVTLLRESELEPLERSTLALLARVRLQADGRSLAEQMARLADRHERELNRRRLQDVEAVVPPWITDVPAAEAPRGSFSAQDGRYAFAVSATQQPPQPWINVLANPHFGCHVSEMAAGHTWADNSRMHQITRWSNDPLTDPPGEWLLLQDLDNGRVWPLGRALQGAGQRSVEHGIGFTRMTQRIGDVEARIEWCVDAEAAVKQVQLRLRSSGGHALQLRCVALVEWQMGPSADARLSVATQHVVLPATDARASPRQGLLATQLDASAGFGGATAWLAFRDRDADDKPGSVDEWTCDRREFYDMQGRLVLPARLGAVAGSGTDPCAALGRTLTIKPDQTIELTLLLGHVHNAADAPQAIAAAMRVPADERLAQQRAQWRTLGAPLQVRTPDAAFDALVNHWLPYQTVACRLWARSGFFQNGGAFGFRDQLQDAMSMLTLDPSLLAAQLRISASRQFAEGDVQHWWHMPGGAGVRTHFSDDRLWLPFALAHYVQRTADAALLDETVAFLDGRPVPAGAEDIYETPQVSHQRASIYEHAARAVDCSLAVGANGLPLMGSGDWNDGMNRVGHGGQGESVWLAWFVCAVIDGMLPLAGRFDDQPRTARWKQARAQIVGAIEGRAWDGQWYRRATFDDGSWLGAAASAECRIDLIAQAWSVLSAAGDASRAAQALGSAARELWDDEAQLLRLLDPPLQHARPEAGYIQAYPPGVRENGGQYNHAAAWAVMAAADLQRADWAWAWWRAVSPAHRLQRPALRKAYGGEPYVVAGDIYSAEPRKGHCGWSWYTGSAGWLWRAATESLCGIEMRQHQLRIQPCLPPDWDHADVLLQAQGRRIRLTLCAHGDAARTLRQQPGCLGMLPRDEWVAMAELVDGGHYVVDASAMARHRQLPSLLAMPT